jgi:hypothetical protein
MSPAREQNKSIRILATKKAKQFEMQITSTLSLFLSLPGFDFMGKKVAEKAGEYVSRWTGGH